jgi:hypothetical protein
MAIPTRNDLEYSKFWRSSLGDVFVDIEQTVEDPLASTDTLTSNDLELMKFTNTGKVRVVLTI